MENGYTKRIAELEEELAEPIRLCVYYTDDFSCVEIGISDKDGDILDREVKADAVMRIIEKLRQQIAALIAENKTLCERKLEYENQLQGLVTTVGRLATERDRLRTLVDGAAEIVENFGTTPAQIKWRIDWVMRAKE